MVVKTIIKTIKLVSKIQNESEKTNFLIVSSDFFTVYARTGVILIVCDFPAVGLCSCVSVVFVIFSV